MADLTSGCLMRSCRDAQALAGCNSSAATRKSCCASRKARSRERLTAEGNEAGLAISWPCTSLFCFKTYTGSSPCSTSDTRQTSLPRFLTESRLMFFVRPSTLQSQATANRLRRLYWSASISRTGVDHGCSSSQRPHSIYGLRPIWMLTQGSSIYWWRDIFRCFLRRRLHGR